LSRRHKYDPSEEPMNPDQQEKPYLPAEAVSSLGDLDDLVTTVEAEGIDLSLEGKMPSVRTRNLYRELDADDEEGTLPAETLDKTNDPVRLYLREMGTVPLLTREGEIEIAKRFERGHMRTLKALSRSPVVIREMMVIGEDLERGVRSIKEIVDFEEEDLTHNMVEARLNNTIRLIHDIASH